MVIVISYYLAGKATTPLKELTKAIQLMGQGYLRQRLDVRGTDEVACLAVAFNKMSQELEKGDEELRAFVANASHELRSPVSAMKTLVEAAIMQVGHDPAREYLEDINKETDRLTSLMQELLVLSRLENRALTWHPESVNFSSCVLRVLENVLPIARSKNIKINDKITGDLYVWGQSTLLERLVYNLLGNALKYTNETGSIEVNLAQASGEIVFEVADTGMGIPEHAQNLVWQRFFRLDKARSREQGGSGLGLSLVRQISELHRAEIDLISEEGRGTKIRVISPGFNNL